MSNQRSSDHGREFDRYLQGDSGLSRLYKQTATEQPPAELDAAILARARDEAGPRPRRGRRPFARTWFVPISLAAVLVLAVGLVTLMYEQGGTPFAPEPLPPTDKKTLEPAEQRDTLLRDAPRQDEKAPLRKGRAVGKPSPTTAPQEAGGTASTAPAPSARPSPREERELKQERLQAPEGTKSDDALAPLAAETPAALSPEAWLRQIAQLREQGKLDEAEASLAEFKQRYPDYPIETILK